jgi:hypothetical protein
MSSLYDLFINQDLSPKLIGKFSKKAKNVVVEVFDQNNRQIPISVSNCIQITYTSRWVWSTKHLPNNVSGKLTYKMISDTGEIFTGEF